ncbi:MAG: MFS transporter [Cyanobacteria bacterium P01_F01_bin.143]
MLFTLAAILVTANISQLRMTLPLYFGDILSSRDSAQIFSSTIANLFTYYTFLIIISQLPLSHFLNRWNRLSALMFSLLLYLGGFIIFWLAGLTPSFSLAATIIGLALLAFAVAAYGPLSLAFITDIAPESLRGIYLSINSLSWTIGFAIGPSLGGWFLEHPQINGFFNFWLLAATSIVCAFLILLYLNHKFYESQETVLTSSPS